MNSSPSPTMTEPVKTAGIGSTKVFCHRSSKTSNVTVTATTSDSEAYESSRQSRLLLEQILQHKFEKNLLNITD